MKKALKLDTIAVKSFVTKLDAQPKEIRMNIRGGIATDDYQKCTATCSQDPQACSNVC